MSIFKGVSLRGSGNDPNDLEVNLTSKRDWQNNNNTRQTNAKDDKKE